MALISSILIVASICFLACFYTDPSLSCMMHVEIALDEFVASVLITKDRELDEGMSF